MTISNIASRTEGLRRTVVRIEDRFVGPETKAAFDEIVRYLS